MTPLLLLACVASDGGTFWGGGKGGGSGTSVEDDTGEPDDSGGSGDSGETGQAPLECTGDAAGDVICDLEGEDQTGQDWSLHDQLGQPVLLMVGHMDLASMIYSVEAIAEVEKQTEVLSVLLVGRDEYSTAADADDAARWASELDADVVLTDPYDLLIDEWSDYSPPKTYIIDETMTVVEVWFGNVESAALLEALGE